jgi:DNA-binding beta-propeller fold protein YncE
MPVQGNPLDLVNLPGQTAVYAVIYPSFGAAPAIAVIDGTQLKITATIALPANTFPICGALSPDGTTLYVSNAGTSELTSNPNTSILVIDTASQTVTGSIAAPPPATENLFGYYMRLAVSPDGTLLYATGAGGYLEAIDTLTLAPVSFIQLPPGQFVTAGSPPPHIVFAPDGAAAYVAVGGPRGPSIYAINPLTSQPVNSVAIGSATSVLTDLVVSANGSTLYTIDESTGITYPVNTATFAVGTPIPRQSLQTSATDPIGFAGLAVYR